MRLKLLLPAAIMLALTADACGNGPSDPDMPGDMMPDMQAVAPPADSAAAGLAR